MRLTTTRRSFTSAKDTGCGGGRVIYELQDDCLAMRRVPLRELRSPGAAYETLLLVTRYRSVHSRISVRIAGNSTWAQSNNSMRLSVSLPYWR